MHFRTTSSQVSRFRIALQSSTPVRFRNQLTSVEIPNSVETIEFRAFEENKLTSVTIPSSVTSIKPRAFWGNLLTSMTILDSVTTIGWQAFASNQLTTISLGKNVTSIDSQAFYQNQLTSVIIPNSVKAIGQNSFTKNPVREASIPDSIQHILVKGYIVSDNPSIAEVAVECFDNPGILLLQSVKNLKAVSSALNKITITWSACTGADGYVLYRQAPGETKMSHRYIMAGKGFIDTVEQDGFYFYRVYPYVMVGDDHIFGPSDTYVYALISCTARCHKSQSKSESNVRYRKLDCRRQCGRLHHLSQSARRDEDELSDDRQENRFGGYGNKARLPFLPCLSLSYD